MEFGALCDVESQGGGDKPQDDGGGWEPQDDDGGGRESQDDDSDGAGSHGEDDVRAYDDVDAPWLPSWAHDDGGAEEGGRGDGEDDVRDESQDDGGGRESQDDDGSDGAGSHEEDDARAYDDVDAPWQPSWAHDDGFTKELTGAKLAKSNELMLGDAGGGASE